MKLVYLTIFISLFSFTLLADAKAKPVTYNKLFSVDLDVNFKAPQYLKLNEMIDNNITPTMPMNIKQEDKLKKLVNTIKDIFGLEKKEKNSPSNIINLDQLETREKPFYEDQLISILARMPQYTYQYIGPYMHSLPFMSEKILNMPGIKETKGKLPTRIAPAMKKIVDQHGDFLSPALYFLLMPETWEKRKLEKEKTRSQTFSRQTKFKRNNKLYERIAKQIPIEDYLNGEEKYTPNMTRTKNPDLNSPLTDGDVIAFANSIMDIRLFGKENKQRRNHIRRIGYLLNNLYNPNGTMDPTGLMKDVANPCQRLAQRVKILGLETEFNAILLPHGFNIDSWAYTGDKTIKAYRLSNITMSQLHALRNAKFDKKKRYTKFLTQYESDFADKAYALYIELYNANEHDRNILWHNKSVIKKQFTYHKDRYLLSLPISLLY